jgi:hypothetical protein
VVCMFLCLCVYLSMGGPLRALGGGEGGGVRSMAGYTRDNKVCLLKMKICFSPLSSLSSTLPLLGVGFDLAFFYNVTLTDNATM